MADNKFDVLRGKFICQECKVDVLTARFWKGTGEVSWMCESKHLSKVGLIPQKKKKKDYEREI